MSVSIYSSTIGKEKIMQWHENILQTFPQGTETFNIDTPYGNTHITKLGDASKPPVILFHGGFMNGLVMKNLMITLSKNHCVYAPDIIGMPGKSAETRPSYLTDDYSKWVSSWMNGLNISSASFVVLSLGDVIFLNLAQHQPQRISKAIFLDGGGFISGQKKGILSMVGALFRAKLFSTKKTLKKAPVKAFYAKGTTPDDDLMQIMGYGFKYIKMDSKGREKPPYTREELADFMAPVMLVYGKKDRIFPAKLAIEQGKATLQNVVRTEVIEGHGHFIGLEKEEEVFKMIVDFLKD